MAIFFTSDLHLGHQNICRLGGRPFENVEEMNRVLISNINARVAQNDTLYILGDVSYRIGRDEAGKLIKQINCEHLHLIRGNHDKHWEETNVFEDIQDYQELVLDDTKVILMHYPILSWNGMHRGSVHLHGHSHNTWDYNAENMEAGKRLWDVGVDANDYAPVSWNELKSLLVD